MVIENFSELYKAEVYENFGINPVEYNIKMTNIDSFLHINREGLKNGKVEKRLLMYRSVDEESIFIEYPGKESTKEYENREQKNILNPNDFRPELHMKDGTVLAKMSFVDIIEALVEYNWTHDIETMQKLAALIIKIAFMKDYKLVELAHPSYLLTIDENKKQTVSCEMKTDIVKRYFLPFNSETKKYLSEWDKINLPNRNYTEKISVSIEAFLYYLDILAQQEDCKYYYTRRLKGENSIKIGVGRINNLMTVVHVIDRIICNRPYGDIVSVLGRYVRPINAKDIEHVTGGLIKTIPSDKAIEEITIK